MQLSDMDENRLVQNVMEYIERIAIGWWREYQSLLEKYEIDSEVSEWRRNTEGKEVKDWWAQVEDKSSLKWYKWVKEEFEMEGYLKRLDNYDVRLRLRLRCGAAGLFGREEENQAMWRRQMCFM